MPDHPPAALTPARERLVLAVLAAAQFTSIVDFMLVMPLGPPLERELNLTPDGFGLIVSAYTYAAAAAGLVAVTVLDRVARRPAFLTAFAGLLIGTLACGLAPGHAGLLAARVLAGAFGGIMGGLALAIIGDVFPENRRGWASGVLMSAFAVASVAGVPLGVALGQDAGWRMPFLALSVLGLPVLAAAAVVLPRLDRHLRHRSHVPPLTKLRETFAEPNHQRAFALMGVMMLAGFLVVPFLGLFLVKNVGLPEGHLPFIYIAGGAVTLLSSPLVGKRADRHGKRRVFRLVSPLFAAAVLAVTNLPPLPTAVAAAVMAFLFATSAGRMVPAMAMITSSVTPARRGGFLAANAAVQHLAAGLGATASGMILGRGPNGELLHYPVVGAASVLATLASLWLAGRLRVAGDPPIGLAGALDAAARATADADEPVAVGAAAGGTDKRAE